MRKDELSKELSKATLETLSIIIYKQGSTRAEIDYIRGVNSSFILRNLLIRGLIQKESHPTDSRKYFYKPTFELLGFLGIQKLEELPDYQMLAQALGKEAKEEESQSEEETRS
jgi:segregation and condensation protein B